MMRKLLAVCLLCCLSALGQTAQPSQAAKPGQWALLIGINDYPGEIQDLRFARDDARALKDLLLASAGFSAERVQLLTDDGAGAARATKANILAAIAGLAPRIQSNDQLIVFLAGHGIVRGLGTAAKSYYLPVDVNVTTSATLEQSALDMEELARQLSALPAAQFTVFVDACREDPFPGRGFKGNTMTDVMARGLRIVKRASAAPGSAPLEPPTSVIFYACRVGERAYENAQLQHGVFTYYILRGLRELAASPDGRVEAGLLAGYLRDNVRKWAQEAGNTFNEQTPTMIATEVRGPVLIARVLPAAGSVAASTTLGGVTLQTSPEAALLTLNGQTAGSGPLFKELPPGQYTARATLAGFQPLDATFTVLPGYQQEVTLTLQPLTVNSSYERGVAFETQQLWPQAIASYEQALREDPNSLAAYERLANVYIKNNREREAVALLTTAIQKYPNNALLLARRSRARSVQVMPEPAPVVAPPPPVTFATAPPPSAKGEKGEKNEKAGKKSKQNKDEAPSAPESDKKEKKGKKKKDVAWAASPRSADSLIADVSGFAFAEPAQKKSKKDKAASDEPKSDKKSGKKKKQQDEPEPEPPLTNVSRSVAAPPAASEASVVSEAVRDAEQAVQADPNLAAAQLALGFAYLLDKPKQAQAVAAFVRASTLAPEDAEAYYGIGYAYRVQGQFQQAIPQLKKALALRPDYYEAQRELAYCFHSQGDTDQAIRQYQLASGQRSKTKNADEAAANNLALASLYKKKGEKVGGKEGEEYKKAGQAYEVEARQFSPTLKGASRVLAGAGVSKLVETVLPESVNKNVGVGVDGDGKVNVQTKLPGGVKVRVPVKVPVKVPGKKLPIKLPFKLQ